MNVHKLDPLADSSWPEFVKQHPESSLFHTTAWLKALQLTYAYKPVVFTTSKSKDFENGVVFCEIDSWLTGKRLVSLPFSDHCQPLADGGDLKTILAFLDGKRSTERWKYVELRPALDEGLAGLQTSFTTTESFKLQQIDLVPDREVIYRRFHDNCVRRKIKRADREKLKYEFGSSEELLGKFCHLLLMTRRRHKLPPQPVTWFRNLMTSFGEDLTIHLLSKDEHPIASIITLRHKTTLVYKYGCSDAQFHNLGGMPLLFWSAIQQAKQMGAETFDLGRSGYDDPGLIAFKEHLGATSVELTYYRNAQNKIQNSSPTFASTWARQTLARLPNSLLIGTGRVLYRHLG